MYCYSKPVSTRHCPCVALQPGSLLEMQVSKVLLTWKLVTSDKQRDQMLCFQAKGSDALLSSKGIICFAFKQRDQMLCFQAVNK